MTQAVSRLRQLDYKQGVIYFGFLGIFLFFALTLHDVGFLSPRNLTNIILQT